MDVFVKGRGIEITPAMREYAQKKITKLTSFNSDLRSAEVTCKVERGENKVEVTIMADGFMLRAEERRGDMYEAIDAIVEKLEHQARKHRKRLIDRARGHSVRDVPAEMEESDQFDVDVTSPVVTRVKRFQMKPMTPAEAAVEMDLLGHTFFVFRNGVGGEVNVVYRRDDGAYGLIEPGDDEA